MTATATRPLTDTDDSLLRFALRLDATLTGLIGLAIAALAGPMASLTGLSPTTEAILGASFAAYGLVVYGLARLPRVRTAGWCVIAANLLCTVGAVLVVVDGLAPLTAMGVTATLGSAVYTAVMAALQYLGMRRLA